MLGVALRMIIPKIVGEGLSSWFELVKPLVEFKWEVINSRINSMFELATQEVLSCNSETNSLVIYVILGSGQVGKV